MTVLYPRRLGVLVTVLGLSAVSGCSDDDSPPDEPTPPAETDAGEVTTTSAPNESSSSSSGDAGFDAAVTSSETSSRAATTSTEVEAGPPVETTPDAADGAPPVTVEVGLLEGLQADPETTVFAQLIVRAQMETDLVKEGPLTILVPTNDGFSRLPAGYLDSLSRKQVEILVRTHLLEAPLSAEELVGSGTFLSVLELSHQFVETEGEIYVDGLTRFLARDRVLGGHKVHKVDSVLTVEAFPGTLAQAVHAYPRLSEFEAHLTAADDALLAQDDKTLFAPINGAFDAVLAVAGDAGASATAVADAASDAGATGPELSAMSYHVLPHKQSSFELASGVTQTATGAYLGLSNTSGFSIHDGQHVSRVLVADLAVSSGAEGSVLHVVEQVLVEPPAIDQVLATGFSGETFATLRAQLTAATMPNSTDSFLSHVATGDAVTLFAPTDAAFSRISGSFGGSLSKVVGFHVIDDVVDSPDLAQSAGDELPATLGTSPINTFRVVTVSGVAGDALLLDGFVQVVVRDIPAANGVIHAVDGVLVPQDVPFPGSTPQALAAYPALSKVSNAVAQTALLTGTSTLFAPFDLAYGEIDSALSFVEAHSLSPGVRDRAAFEIGSFASLAGTTIVVDAETLVVDEVNIVRPDLLTGSGVVHIIDGVLGSQP